MIEGRSTEMIKRRTMGMKTKERSMEMITGRSMGMKIKRRSMEMIKRKIREDQRKIHGDDQRKIHGMKIKGGSIESMAVA